MWRTGNQCKFFSRLFGTHAVCRTTVIPKIIHNVIVNNSIRSDIFEHIRLSSYKVQEKFISSLVNAGNKGIRRSSTLTRKRNNSCIIPSLTADRINEITALVGITIGVGYISWAKIALPSFTLLDWSAKALPQDFRNNQEEENILKFAYNIKNTLPNADLYVMETFSLAGREFYEKINVIQLSSMLTVLLNGVDTEPDWEQKVFYQKKYVMNSLHGLLIGSERVSTRLKVDNILDTCSTELGENAPKGGTDIYSSIEIHPKFLEYYKDAYLEKKEDLSLALLFTLSFIDVNILKNECSLSKIQRKRRRMTKL